MFNKTLLKRKAFTLIELMVALALMVMVIGGGLKLLTQQIKTKKKFENFVDSFIHKQIFLDSFRGCFFHLAAYDTSCLKADHEEIYILYDAGKHLDSKKSGIVQGKIYLNNKRLFLEMTLDDSISQIQMLNDLVEEFSVSFYSQETLWQSDWDSTKEGLPEMLHLVLKTSKMSINQKFLLPYSLKPINVVCKSSPLFSR